MAPPIIKRYFVTLNKYKVIPLLALCIGVGGASMIGMQSPPPTTYQADGILANNTPPVMFSNTGTQIQNQGTQLKAEILAPETLLKTVASQVNISPKDLSKNLLIKVPVSGSRAGKGGKDTGSDSPGIEVFYVDNNPKRAETTLRLLMQGMVEQSRILNTARLRAIIKAINEQLVNVKKDLQLSEQKLERYIRIEGPAIWAAHDGSVLGIISSSQQQQRQIQMTLAGIETQMRSLSVKLGLTPQQAYTSSALSSDPIIANLRAQIYQNEMQLQILSRDMRPEHPTIIDLRKKQQVYEQQLQQRAAEVIGNRGVGEPLVASKIREDSSLDPTRQQLANTLVNLQTQRETLQQQLLASIKAEQEARQEYAKLPNKQIEQTRLQQQLQLQQAFYNKIQTSLADAKLAEAETASSLSISQLPKITSNVKLAPNLLITVGSGAFVSLLVAGGLIFFLSTLDSILYTPEEIRALLKEEEVLLLGELPFVNILSADCEEMPILMPPDSAYLPYYERFRSNLRRISDQPVKVLLFTSTINDEGKTISAYNLAIASAMIGKRTLIIEADLRSPSHAKALNVEIETNNNADPLSYYAHLNECIQLVPDIENLYIVPNQDKQSQAAAILESSEFCRLLEDARGRFDLVVLDTPSLSICNDALLLESYTDGIVLVTRPGYTQTSFLSEAIEQLNEAEIPLLGAIINAIEKPNLISNNPKNINKQEQPSNSLKNKGEIMANS